jgi:hypothetical protein
MAEADAAIVVNARAMPHSAERSLSIQDTQGSDPDRVPLDM